MENINIESLMNMAKSFMGNVEPKVEEWKKSLINLHAEGVAGGGNVKITINGHYKIQKLSIEPEFITLENKILLQETIIAAYNNAHEMMKGKIKNLVQEQTGGTGFPLEGLF